MIAPTRRSRQKSESGWFLVPHVRELSVFTQEGEIIIFTKVLEKDESSGMLSFSVRDTGIGL
jgi:hypothetical protein